MAYIIIVLGIISKVKFEGKDCSIPLPSGEGYIIEFEEITDKFGIGFTKAISNVAFDNLTKIVQVEFDCKILWIIDKGQETV